MPHDMTQTMTARLAQQAERAAKDKRKAVRQPIDNEDFRQPPEDIFDQNANEPEEPDYRWDFTYFVVFLVFLSQKELCLSLTR